MKINESIILCGLVLTASLFVNFYGLGTHALADYDEATYASVLRETRASGDFLTLKHPVTGTWFEKPPLYFWISAPLESSLANKEAALRLPSATLGVVAILFTMLLAYALSGNYFLSALAGFILLTTPSFMEAARQVRLDVPVTAAIVFGFYSFLRGLKNPWWFLCTGVGLAIGFMFKSAVSFLLLPAIIIYSLVHRDFSWLKEWHLYLGLLAGLLLLLPWHIYETLRFGGSFWNEYVFHHVLERFTGNVIGGGGFTANYAELLLRFATPWIVLLPVALIAGGLSVKKFYAGKAEGFEKNYLAFGLIAAFIFALFGISGTKIFYYLTPMYPFVALAGAFLLGHFYTKSKNHISKTVLASLVFIMAVAGIFNTYRVVYHKEENYRITELISNEERQVGLHLSREPIPAKVFVYKYPYYETIRYYSDERPIQEMLDGEPLSESFFLIMSKPFFDSASFPPELGSRLETVYQGESVILLKFI